ncbi:MAG TPA: ABC transporter permease [Vicinamibacterales bacterium]|nr:ABC transporter permease [Vicinamibacterales bacterium]
MAALWQDVRYAARMLRRQPGFAAVAVLSLALGIGANTTIFSLLNSIFFHPLPVAEPSRLVDVFTTDARNPGFLPVSFDNFKDYRDQTEAFSGALAYQFVPISLGAERGEQPQVVAGQIVTGNYFSLLGVTPALGRFFLPEEDQVPDRNPVVVLGNALWRTRYGADRGIVGRTIQVNGMAFTVIGVAPRAFIGTDTGVRVALWVPMMMHHRVLPLDAETFDSRRALMFSVIARLKPGVSTAQAASQVQAVGERLAQAYPTDNKGRGGRIVPLAEAAVNPNIRGVFKLAGLILMTVVGLVLLIACANVASLLLARATARRREIAVRVSLGASRWRLARQLVTESLLLSLAAGGLGLVLGVWARDLLLGLAPAPNGPFVIDLGGGFDLRVLGFTLAVAVVTGVLFGLAPAIQATRPDLVVDLKERSSQVSDMRSHFSLRKILVVAQVALSFVALVGSGLFLRSLHNAQQINPGFRTGHLALVTFNVQAQGYSQPRGEAFYRQVLDRVQGLPGVRRASLSTMLPLSGGGFMRSVFIEGQAAPPGGNGVLVLTNTVTPGYFETMGIRLRTGRMFASTDIAGGPRVAIINETMAKKFWPAGDAVGHRFRFFGQDDPLQIVGVVADSKFGTLGEQPQSCAYTPMAQSYAGQVSLEAWTTGDPAAALGTIRSAVQGLDPNLPLTGVTTMNQVLDQSLVAARLGAITLGAFGLLALVLAAIGLYGVMAYLVTQRTQEIGVRMALGARAADVRWLVVRQGMVLALAGIGVGAGAGLLLARAASGLLYNVSAIDAPTFVVIPLLLGTVALLATILPARRATRIDPMLALRCE